MTASTDVARVLLAHGANPNWCDDEGNSPLHRVVRSRIVVDPANFVQVLLEFGADASARNREARTPLDEALLQQEKIAQTYFPVRQIAPKRLAKTIELLRSRMAEAG
jgi:ankyrin repeat protein